MIERILPQKESEYTMPTEIIFGSGVISETSNEKKVSGRKILLVCGEHFRKSSDFENLEQKLKLSAKSLIIFERKITVSDFAAVNGLTEFVRAQQPEVIIAVGGGTILDTAKCAAVLAKNSGIVEDYLINGNILTEDGLDFVAIPTTAGTGSEVTPWAVVWDYENYEKYSLSSPLMFPSLAIVDPSLTDELPPKVTAETGMDALTQAIEAYWSRSHNPISDKYALKSIALAMKFLAQAVNCPNENSRNMMSKASLFSGLAFSNTKTTICHSVSYPITIHWGVAHGQAVAITLPVVIRYSLPVMEGREKELIKVLGANGIDEAADVIEKLMRKIGLATELSELGINKDDLPTIVSEGYNPDRSNNTPRFPSKEELYSILEKIL